MPTVVSIRAIQLGDGSSAARAVTTNPTVLAANANPAAAEPSDVLAEIKNWRQGGGSEIFVKVAMDAYMRELFQGLPDSVINTASLFIYNTHLSDIE